MSFAAPASAQSLDDLGAACRDAEVVPGSCAGISKLTERAAAECRRAGAPDESCVAPMSRKVIRSEVSAHQSSWLHRTLAFQYELGNAASLREAMWLGTHNSFNSPAAETTLSSTDSNQQLSLTDQLRIDIRSLELDVHWFPSTRANGQFAPVVCHARGASEGHAGCTTERLLGETLDEIVTWLNANDDQVLLLYIEDAIDSSDGYAPTAALLNSKLRDEDGRSLIYKPPPGGACTDLPLSLTRDKVLAARGQVVLVSGCGQPSAWRSLVFNWSGTHVEGGGEGYQDAPDCDPRFDDATYATKLVRFFEDSTWLSATVDGGESEGLTPEITRRMTRCGVDLFGFDQLLPRDGRLEATAWSWAPNEPAKASDCALQRSDGRWISRKCTKRHKAACVRPDGRWFVTSSLVPQNAASAACKPRGATHAAPRTGEQNEALRLAARSSGADGVWLPTFP